MTDKSCERCKSLMACIQTLESHLDIMKNSLNLATDFMLRLKSSPSFCQSSSKPVIPTPSPIITRSSVIHRVDTSDKKASESNKKKPPANNRSKKTSQVNNTPSDASMVLADDIQLSAPVSQLDAPATPSIAIIASTSTASVIGSSPSPATQTSGTTILRGAAQRKSVFVSRLHVDTSSDDLQSFLMEKLGASFNASSFHIHKLKVDRALGYSSFKIIIVERNQDLFNSLLSDGFWPSYLLVHEYFRRENQSVSADS